MTRFLWWWESKKVPSLPVVVVGGVAINGSQDTRVIGLSGTRAAVELSDVAPNGGALLVGGQVDGASPGGQPAPLVTDRLSFLRTNVNGDLIVSPYAQWRVFVSGVLDDVAIGAGGIATVIPAPAAVETVFITSVCAGCLAQSTVKLECPAGTVRACMRMPTAVLQWQHTFPVPLVGAAAAAWGFRSSAATTFNVTLAGYIVRTA